MKKIYKVAVFILLLAGLTFGGIKLANILEKKNTSRKYSIVSTSFPGYDFARAVVGNNTDISVKMLLKPGAESHSFEPTPQDILAIKNSNLFLYVGGDSDEWVKKVISEIDPKKTKVLKLKSPTQVSMQRLVLYKLVKQMVSLLVCLSQMLVKQLLTSQNHTTLPILSSV